MFTISVMSLTWFVPYFPLIMVYTSELLLLIFSNLLSVKKALRYDFALGFHDFVFTPSLF